MQLQSFTTRGFRYIGDKAREFDQQMIELKQKIITSSLNIPIEYLIGVGKLVHGSETFQQISLRYTEFDV